METKLFRIAAHHEPFADAWGTHLRNANALVAYESGELAALCTHEQLEDRAVLLREVLIVPSNPEWHERLSRNDVGLQQDEQRTRETYARYMQRKNILCAWLPSAMAPNQSIVMLNPEHPGFRDIRVESRYITAAHDFQQSMDEHKGAGFRAHA